MLSTICQGMRSSLFHGCLPHCTSTGQAPCLSCPLLGPGHQVQGLALNELSKYLGNAQITEEMHQ